MSQNFNNSSKTIYHAYSLNHPKPTLDCPEKPFGRTKQSFKAECDINTIIQRFLKTGQIDLANRLEPRYGDATGLEYTQAMLTVAKAKSLFAELPAALRGRFENDPAKFLDFVQDDKNMEEARELGLLKSKAPAAADAATASKAPAAADAATAPPAPPASASPAPA